MALLIASSQYRYDNGISLDGKKRLCAYCYIQYRRNIQLFFTIQPKENQILLTQTLDIFSCQCNILNTTTVIGDQQWAAITTTPSTSNTIIMNNSILPTIDSVFYLNQYNRILQQNTINHEDVTTTKKVQNIIRLGNESLKTIYTIQQAAIKFDRNLVLRKFQSVYQYIEHLCTIFSSIDIYIKNNYIYLYEKIAFGGYAIGGPKATVEQYNTIMYCSTVIVDSISLSTPVI